MRPQIARANSPSISTHFLINLHIYNLIKLNVGHSRDESKFAHEQHIHDRGTNPYQCWGNYTAPMILITCKLRIKLSLRKLRSCRKCLSSMSHSISLVISKISSKVLTSRYQNWFWYHKCEGPMELFCYEIQTECVPELKQRRNIIAKKCQTSIMLSPERGRKGQVYTWTERQRTCGVVEAERQNWKLLQICRQYTHQQSKNDSFHSRLLFSKFAPILNYINFHLNPDPRSSHFATDQDRYNKDFAQAEKEKRDNQSKLRRQLIEQKRIEKYERDMKRWEFMDDENNREQHKLRQMQNKYLTGRQHRGGAAYNVINLKYEESDDGVVLQQRDVDQKVRALIRSKNLDVRNNCGYNPINGSERMGIDVPIHDRYFPPERALQSVGAFILGTDYAGRPLRKELYSTPNKPQNFSQSLINPIGQQEVGRNAGQERMIYAQSQLLPNQDQQQLQQYLQEHAMPHQIAQYNSTPNLPGINQRSPSPRQFQEQSPGPRASTQIQVLGNRNNAATILPLIQQQQALYGGQSQYYSQTPYKTNPKLITTEEQNAYYGSQSPGPYQIQTATKPKHHTDFRQGGAGTKFY